MKLHEFSIGQEFETKSLKLTKESIMDFAAEFDPQYMHVNEERAKQSRFNGIIASGIHTLSITFKLWVELEPYGDDVIAGTGMNNIKYLKPVFPGDVLRTIAEVIDKEVKNEKSGIVTVKLSTYNDRDEKVFVGELSALIKR